ncbi:MAG: cation:dicarboxylase symporter family transporter, partial [Acidobacteriota bacterium]|nr:cation:dicarboxylase symporter family transporter [Acidobacteriota bacterium]
PAGQGGFSFAAEHPPSGPIDWLDVYIPSNVFHALAFNAMPAVVLFGILAGMSLGTMDEASKRPLLDALEAFNEAMGRTSRLITRLAPVGVFAMTAAAAGTLRVEEFIRLQVWFVVYIGLAVLLAWWVLPAFVALLTPVSYRRFVDQLQTAALTAFAAGDYFVVLPMIAEANKQLLEEHGVTPDEAEGTIGVAVPLLFNFPHTGKLLTLAFFPFAAWFSSTDLSPAQWFSVGTAGVLSLFGNINAAVPFMLDLLRLPADLFNLFTVSSVLNVRFGSLTAAVHTAALSMLVAASLLGRLRVDVRQLARMAVMTAIVIGVFIGGTRVAFSRFVPTAPSGVAALEGFVLRGGVPPAEVRQATEPAVPPGPSADRLAEVLARGTLRVGFFSDGVPYTFFNPAGQLVGYDVEMAYALTASMGVSPEFVPIERSRIREALDSGTCDVVMSGLVVTMASADIMDFSVGYTEERIGFLVLDHRRGEFVRGREVAARPLRLGVLSPRFIEAVRRRLPRATVEPRAMQNILDAGDLGVLDAMVLPIDEAIYASRIQPAFAAVLPEDDDTRGVIAYAVPRGADSLRDFINTWIAFTSASGGFADARRYWIDGRAQAVQTPRWSVASNVLGLW